MDKLEELIKSYNKVEKLYDKLKIARDEVDKKVNKLSNKELAKFIKLITE